MRLDEGSPSLRPSEVVGRNLYLARRLRKKTQEQAADLLEPYLGVRWSKTTFSAAENSSREGKWREFTADELVAFSRAFDLPITWFFLPPRSERGDLTLMETGDDGLDEFLSPAQIVLDLLFMNDYVQGRVREILESQRFADRRGAGRQFQAEVNAQLLDVMRATVGDIHRAQSAIRDCEEILDNIQKEARKRIESPADADASNLEDRTSTKSTPRIGKRKGRSDARTHPEKG